MVEKNITRIKICGITNVDDALIAAHLGVDALGFVFTASPRQITTQMAHSIIKQLPPFITTVGIFMDASLDYVQQVSSYTGIDIIQLHGAETPGYCRQLRKKIIKRIAIQDGDTPRSILKKARDYQVSAFLFDPGCGSGKTFDWRILQGIELTPMIIAGGLNADNVPQVISLLRPYGVDVATGVETSSGRKDPEKIKKFLEEVQQCC